MTPTLHIIVIEDDADDVTLLLRELRRGYTLNCVQVDSLAGLRAALATRDDWDIVISDWSLADFDGLDAFHVVRESGVDLPFIVVSGTITEENAVAALKVGVADFVSKGRYARLLPAIDRELREAVIRREKRAADRDLERQRAELAVSEQLLRSVLRTVPDGVVVVDASGRVVIWSAAVDVVLGAPSHLPLEAWAEHYGLHRSDRATPLSGGDLALAVALRGGSVDRQELFAKRGGAEGRWLNVSGRPLRNAEGQVTGAVAVFRDVTAEKAAQEQLMVADRMASIGMLAAGVAHEINNPLGAALLNLEIAEEALKRPRTPDEELEIGLGLQDARAAVCRVREIVGDLRILSRQSAPPESRSSESVDLVDVRDALELSLRMAQTEIRHRAQIVRAYEAVPLVAGSAGRLGQVFLNLIVNAAQSIREGNQADNTVRVATKTEDQRVVVEIADTGSGIKSEDLPQLFTPFFTTKPPGVGVGLGLPICQRLITAMGGSITVASEVGKGSTFRVVLPIATTTTPTPSISPKNQAQRVGRRGGILVIDDEPMLAVAIQRALRGEHDVVTTTRAEEALARLRGGARFDVIFADLMLPQVTGIELYRRISKEFPEQAARVVFLTGGAFTPAAREFLSSVENRTLEKPIDRDGLLAVIHERVS